MSLMKMQGLCPTNVLRHLHNPNINKATQHSDEDSFEEMLLYNPEEEITTAAAIVPDTKNPWMGVNLRIGKVHDELSYASCPQCMYLITAESEEEFHCFTCHRSQTTMLRV